MQTKMHFKYLLIIKFRSEEKRVPNCNSFIILHNIFIHIF